MQDVNQEKIVGIIGGMGPEATVDLMSRVIRLTPALDDADHIRCIVDNNPKVPSRIKALIDGAGESPVPELQDMARCLEAWGADFLAMPCNTSHYYFQDIQGAVSIPMLNLIEITVQEVLRQQPGIDKVGILGSTALILTGLYQQAFAASGVRVVYPETACQDRVMVLIKDIKKGAMDLAFPVFESSVSSLETQGAQALVIACTELSLLPDASLSSAHQPLPRYDSSDILARDIIRTCKVKNLKSIGPP
ncbi:aspartate racemase [Desulfonatronospira thiodismutans ASO3-1]|uniref:Aspartate racemase n=1 Tax=Desulfonatronospira thiodismutans ASO3-1 TaxID=555779 RepID=D6SP26_9BACT|nr:MULTISPECIES: amino acid racemase [Desulfonatronospira]EFI34502.1 aspartate racemase [Desulfonatronospira thiodismutans ASO3-1]RQD73365.1 MAG: amino acid racemase [Desulfonatronospira sp. MSAO_Bac3]